MNELAKKGPSLDGLKAQIDAMDVDARERPHFVSVVSGLMLTLGKPTYADNFAYTVRRPEGMSEVLGVTGCFIRPMDGSFLADPWYISWELTQEGNIRVLYMTGLAVGSTYKYSLSVVGV
jgi:hypothetical protein